MDDWQCFNWTASSISERRFLSSIEIAGHKQDKNKKACKVTINGLCIDEWLLDSSGIVERCFTIPEDSSS